MLANEAFMLCYQFMSEVLITHTTMVPHCNHATQLRPPVCGRVERFSPVFGTPN